LLQPTACGSARSYIYIGDNLIKDKVALQGYMECYDQKVCMIMSCAAARSIGTAKASDILAQTELEE
jgi:hypothetical protein